MAIWRAGRPHRAGRTSRSTELRGVGLVGVATFLFGLFEQFGQREVAVLPTHFKCLQSGAALPVENPEVWVYQDDINDSQEPA